MEKTTEEKRKLMSIVIMVIIMLLTLLLMITTFSVEHLVGGNLGDSGIHIDGDDKPDKTIDALLTMQLPENVTLHVKASELSKESVGNLPYLSIDSEQKSGVISLKSKKDITTCKYNVVYIPEYNYFENKYVMSNESLGVLKNQLTLSIFGSQMNGVNQTGIDQELDIIEINNQETILFENILITDYEDEYTTNIEWKFKLTFRNYRDYNQVNNAGKKAKGKIEFRIQECERTT